MNLISKTRWYLLLLLVAFMACSRDDDPGQNDPVIPTRLDSVMPLTGPRNTEITLWGYFGDNPAVISVRVNGVHATLVDANVHQLRAKVAPGSGDGKVVVSVDGISVTGPYFDFQYTVWVTTFSGMPGVPGYADGNPPLARYHSPAGMCIDHNDNIYVADVENNRIRRVSPGGTVTTFSGSGIPGSVNGSASSACFSEPYDVAFDSINGYFYVADKGNHLVRKLDMAGTAYTAAGIAGSPGYVDAPGASARLNSPTGVEVKDELVNVYVADAGNHCIRKINSLGIVTTFAGSPNAGYVDGAGTSAKFNSPFDVSWDPDGYLYVSDRMNHRIRRINSAGVVTTVAGNGNAGFLDGPANTAWLFQPGGMQVRHGRILLADSYNNRIREIIPGHDVTTMAGDGTPAHADGSGASSKFHTPGSVVRDSHGVFYVSDTDNHCIRRVVID